MVSLSVSSRTMMMASALLLLACSVEAFSSGSTFLRLDGRVGRQQWPRLAISGRRQCTIMSGKVDAASAVPEKAQAPAIAPKPSPPTKPSASTDDKTAPKTAIMNPYMVGKSVNDRPVIPVTFEDVSKAAHDIKGAVYKTGCARNVELSELTGCNLWLKTEYKQFTGSFKERGARNALMQLDPEQKKRGVIAASAGNHALGLAYHSKLLGIPVTVVMPTTAPITKVDKCRKLGANVILKGAHIGEAKDYALSDPQFAGMRYINGYDDPAIIAGAGSLGLEILEQVPDVDVVVVPVGGAGLIAGVALAIKTVRPDVKVIGVEPERCASYTAALKAGSPTAVSVSPTLADGLAVPCVGPHAFEVARHYVDYVVTVSERQVALAVLRLIEHEKAVVEGGGAAGLAALLPGGPLDIPELKGKTVCTPLCGGNIDTSVLGRVLERGLAADRRLVKFVVTVSDRPGGLAKLTSLVSSVGASIWDISHERAWLQNSVDQVRNQVVVELTGREHEKRLRDVLEKEYPACVVWGEEADPSVTSESKMAARYRE